MFCLLNSSHMRGFASGCIQSPVSSGNTSSGAGPTVSEVSGHCEDSL